MKKLTTQIFAITLFLVLVTSCKQTTNTKVEENNIITKTEETLEYPQGIPSTAKSEENIVFSKKELQYIQTIKDSIKILDDIISKSELSDVKVLSQKKAYEDILQTFEEYKKEEGHKHGEDTHTHNLKVDLEKEDWTESEEDLKELKKQIEKSHGHKH